MSDAELPVCVHGAAAAATRDSCGKSLGCYVTMAWLADRRAAHSSECAPPRESARRGTMQQFEMGSTSVTAGWRICPSSVIPGGCPAFHDGLRSECLPWRSQKYHSIKHGGGTGCAAAVSLNALCFQQAAEVELRGCHLALGHLEACGRGQRRARWCSKPAQGRVV